MSQTLDEYLEEVDRWKQAVSDRLLALDPSEWAREDAEARAWLEEKLGHPLRHADEVPKRTPAWTK